MEENKTMTLQEIANVTAQIAYPWVAVDRFGNLFAYRKEPKLDLDNGGWITKYNEMIRIYHLKFITVESGNWWESLCYTAYVR